MRRKSCLIVLLLAMVMMVGCGKSEAVALTEQYIDDIGDVSIDSIEAIEKTEKHMRPCLKRTKIV